MQLLTHSRQDSFKSCRRKHYLAYECGIRRDTDAKALRMGTAFHDALEDIGEGLGIDSAIETASKNYDFCPDGFDATEWAYERETVLRLVMGYDWRWSEMPLEHIATEQSFELPLLNPDTERPSTVFRRAGKIDGIVRLGDGRLAVMEHKLLGDDIGPDSDLWRRMRGDPQISGYVLAARRLGHNVDTVLYDVARKPTIGPTKIPLLDELGAKIVIDTNTGERVKTAQGKWRQTGDKDQGYVLQERMMTPEEWGDKLNNDIAARPDFYFQRVEIPRMDADLREYEEELWELQITLREAQKSGRWYRTVSKNTCGFCSFFDLCFSPGFEPTGPLPVGFVRVRDVHPELMMNRESNNVHGNDSTAAEETAPAPVEGATA
jgi:hypothetical protein